MSSASLQAVHAYVFPQHHSVFHPATATKAATDQQKTHAVVMATSRTVASRRRRQTDRRRQHDALAAAPEHCNRWQPLSKARRKRLASRGVAVQQSLHERQHMRHEMRLERVQREADGVHEVLQARQQQARAQAQHCGRLVGAQVVLAYIQQRFDELRGEVAVWLVALAGACKRESYEALQEFVTYRPCSSRYSLLGDNGIGIRSLTTKAITDSSCILERVHHASPTSRSRSKCRKKGAQDVLYGQVSSAMRSQIKLFGVCLSVASSQARATRTMERNDEALMIVRRRHELRCQGPLIHTIKRPLWRAHALCRLDNTPITTFSAPAATSRARRPCGQSRCRRHAAPLHRVELASAVLQREAPVPQRHLEARVQRVQVAQTLAWLVGCPAWVVDLRWCVPTCAHSHIGASSSSMFDTCQFVTQSRCSTRLCLRASICAVQHIYVQ